MINLIYLYASSGHNSSVTHWDPLSITHNKFARGARTDGMINLFDQVSEKEYVNQVTVCIDSTTDHGGLQLSPHTSIAVLPTMNTITSFIKPGDILIVRGGFKPWLSFIKHIYSRRENWILFYGANTNNHRWPFWDIVLDDLREEPAIINSKLFIPFSKPVHEGIFRPQPRVAKEFDIMVGASHIHRKKGQYHVLLAALEHKMRTGQNWKLLLPGGMIRCLTNKIITATAPKLDIARTGSVSRMELCKLMCKCKLFVHAGVGGQNDRSILEALRCGLPVVMVNSKRSATFISKNPQVIRIVNNVLDTKSGEGDGYLKKICEDVGIDLACVRGMPNQSSPVLERCISRTLDRVERGQMESPALYYQRMNGMREVCLPKMINLIQQLRDRKPGDLRGLAYGE